MARFSLEEILKTDTHDWSISINKEETEIVVASSSVVYHFINRFYGDRIYSLNEETLAEAKSDLRDDWLMYLNRNSLNIERMYDAMVAEYSPIENYDRYEDIEVKHTGTDTVTFNGSESNTKSGNVEMKKEGTETNSNGTGGITTTNYVSGYNEGSPVVDNKSTTEGQTELSFTNRKDTETYNSVKDEKTFTGRNDETEYNSTNKTISHLHGNIGVTTNTEMIERELELRSKNLCDIIVKSFVNEISFYS